jgi:hypothetical protein
MRYAAFPVQHVQTSLDDIWLRVEIGTDSRRVPRSLRACLEEQQNAQVIQCLERRLDEVYDLIRNRFHAHAFYRSDWLND